MKIEMLESLGCSYLRHVQKCWIVQPNWKASDAWPKPESTDRQHGLFQDMKARFDGDRNDVFKGTKSVEQLLKQAEIDVLGLDFCGGIHALEVAFHEAGLNYVGHGGTRSRVLKKLLRSYLVLQGFGLGAPVHLYFISPKVNPATASDLHEVFADLCIEYPDIDWHLYINESFATKILQPTLAATAATSDTSELFLRAARLIDVGDNVRSRPSRRPEPMAADRRSPVSEQLQPIIKGLLRTVLEDHAGLLDGEWLEGLLDRDFCKDRIGLKIGNLPLLRRKCQGREVSGHARYWADVYADSYYVCSQWWQTDHLHNARSLLAWVEQLRVTAIDGPGRDALEHHSTVLSTYIKRDQGEG